MKQPSLSEIYSGTYIPNTTGLANVASVVPSNFMFSKVGNIVTCSGGITITPTASGNTFTKISISLPIPSDFASTSNCSGFGGGAYGLSTSGSIQADTTEDYSTFVFYANYTSALYVRVTFQYEIVE